MSTLGMDFTNKTTLHKFRLIEDGDADFDDHKLRRFPCTKRRHSTRILIAVLALTSVISFCLGLSLGFSLGHQSCGCNTTDTAPHLSAEQECNNSEPESRNLNSLCFPCSEIGNSISDHDTGHIVTLDRQTNLCCMQDVGNLKNLFLLIINEYYRNVETNSSQTGTSNSTKTQDSDEVEVGPVAGNTANSNSSELTLKAPSKSRLEKNFWTKREAAAHMFLDNALLERTNDTAQRLPWDGRDYHNLSMTSDFLTYDPDKRSIQVKAIGLYFVYSSVTLQAPTKDHNAQVYHMLLREHYLLPITGSTIMMMNKYGGGEHSTGFYSSFLCGSFRLRGGDELFVKVSNASFLYNAYYSNYLGLYRLSV